MTNQNQDVEAAFSTIKRLRPVVSPDHRELPEFRAAWAVIYSFCDIEFRRLSHCSCSGSPNCVHQIRDLVQKAISHLDQYLAKNRLIRYPRALVRKMCRNDWLRANERFQRREIHDVEYAEEPYDSDGSPNESYGPIADVVVGERAELLTWTDLRELLQKHLHSKRLDVTETKLFLGHYRDGKTLQTLATFYGLSIAKVSRLKNEVISALQDELRLR